MNTAQNLLVGYGMVILVYGFVLGIPLAVARSGAPQASRHLVTTHLSALMQGPVVLGLAFAIGTVSFDSGLSVIAAGLVIAGLLAESLGGTINWLQGTGDQFAERGLGFRINALTGALSIPGVLIIAVVVVARL